MMEASEIPGNNSTEENLSEGQQTNWALGGNPYGYENEISKLMEGINMDYEKDLESLRKLYKDNNTILEQQENMIKPNAINICKHPDSNDIIASPVIPTKKGPKMALIGRKVLV